MPRYLPFVLGAVILAAGVQSAPLPTQPGAVTSGRSTVKPPQPSQSEIALQKRFEKAIKLQQAGKLDAALDEYNAILKANPKAVPVLINVGLIHTQKEQFAKGEQFLKRALAISPDNEIALGNLVQALLGSGKNTEAVKYAKRLEKIKPKEYRSKFLLGIAAMRARDYSASTQAFKGALVLKPDDQPSLYNLGLTYVNQKKFKEALSVLNRLIAVNPEASEVRFLAAYAAEQSGDIPAASRHLEAAARTAKDPVPALLTLARLYSAAKKEDKAVETYQRVLKLDKSNYEANLRLGQVEYEKQRFNEAEKFFLAAQKAKPKDLTANVYVALAQSRGGNAKAALKSAQAAVNISPKNPTALEVLAYVYELNGKYDDAIAAYRKLQSYYPKVSQPSRKIATAYIMQNKTDLAQAEYEKAVKAFPNDRDLILTYADFLRDGGKYDLAYTQYERAMKLKPGDPPTLVNGAFCLYKQSKFDPAIALLNKAISIDPKNIRAHNTLADLYKAQGKTDLAIAQYRRILEFAPKDIAAHFSLIDIYEDQKNYEAQVEVYRKLKEVDPANKGHATMIPRLYEKMGKLDQAIEEARKLVAEDGSEVSYRSVAGDLLRKKKDYDAAIEQYSEMAKIDKPGAKAAAYEQIGQIRQEQGKTDEAITAYKESLKAQPGSTRVLDALGKIYQDQNKTDEHLAFLKTLIEPGTDDLPYRYFFDAYKKAGKAEDAIKTLEDLSARHSDNQPLQLALASAYQASEQKEKALDIYRKLLASKPDDAWLNKLAGEAYASLGRDEDAVGCYQKAIKTLYFDQTLVRALGGLYEKLGRKTEAADVYRNYLKVDPANQEFKEKVEALETVKKEPAASSAPASEPATGQPGQAQPAAAEQSVPARTE